jgi:hypothetical protein
MEAMTTSDSFVGEDNMITIATIYVSADSAPQALDRALNRLDRIAENSGRIASIETYTMRKLADGRYQIDFA